MTGFPNATSGARFRLLIALLALVIAVAGNGTLAQDATPETADDHDPASSELTSELPPPDLPTSNQQGFRFEIDSTSQINLDAVPREAAVYRLDWKEATERRTARIAEKLGIEGEINDRGNGTYDIQGDQELYVSPGLVQFFSPDQPEEGDLPEDEAAIGFAREWLRTAGLLPNNVDNGTVVSRSDETRRVIVQFIPLEPANLIAAYPSAVVTIGPGGDVIEASVRWPEINRYDVYQLRDPKDAWAEVSSGEAFLDLQLPEGVADDQGVVRGQATYSSIEIGYTTSGLPGGEQYLQPVYIFVGRFVPEGSDSSYRIRAYVSAVANSGAPVG
ncbi:MAG: hypothetical protein KC438_04360 [Thermomicrobiales bacterium]|nr:hypothetical protein [Thermomicrobiales bacterium]MCO5221652.1 hypothetical protein [Thermomicrobiales bacterium]